MTIALTLLALLLTVAPAAAHTFTFPITFTEYFPNLEALESGWRHEVLGDPASGESLVRTGPGTFKLLIAGCIHDHYLIQSVDQVDLGRDDERITGGVFQTHTVSTCPGNRFRQYYGPWRQVGPTQWEPGFGSLSTPIKSHTVYAGENGEVLSFEKVRESNRYFNPILTPDGIQTTWVVTSADEFNEVFVFMEHYFGDVPFCNEPGTAKGMTRLNETFIVDGVVAHHFDGRFCWRKP